MFKKKIKTYTHEYLVRVEDAGGFPMLDLAIVDHSKPYQCRLAIWPHETVVTVLHTAIKGLTPSLWHTVIAEITTENDKFSEVRIVSVNPS